MYAGERFNSISHLVGAALALSGSSVLITVSAFTGSILEIVSVSIYSATLFLLYLSSTLYHSFAGRAKRLFQLFDYQAIYLLIAGTYHALRTARDAGYNWLVAAWRGLGARSTWNCSGSITNKRTSNRPCYHLLGNGVVLRIRDG